ncbi:hypothetical protein BD324DRAFT_649160 [Kockovaella imperatae]|uniref:FAD-binding domain-containing protein n=1 Tax=Kockovaella imperatae TaxID=4999 RepID=A0A1Y1UNH1_9TREE|nr:hypothetical protein BD324DRAFT_649160 [Kockovaella imperatae]ORX39067.1 hypothetical protein BD324DRAFT_649160 [Kockovaella imperatae]
MLNAAKTVLNRAAVMKDPTLARQMSSQPRKPVLIIGAGLGGLVLAHGLRRRNIPFELYERDVADSSRAQGYRITLQGKGPTALETCLPDSTMQSVLQRSGQPFKAMPDGAIVDALSGEKVGSMFEIKVPGGGQLGKGKGGPGSGPGGGKIGPTSFQANDTSQNDAGTSSRLPMRYHFQVDRRELRNDLLKDLPSPHYAKAFERYTATADGVIAHFSDGSSSTEGSLLVGANGVHSRVARQLIGEASIPLDTGVRLVYGKTPLTSDLLEQLSDNIRQGPKLIKDARDPHHQVFLLKDNMEFSHQESPNPYVFWSLIGDNVSFNVPDDKLFAMSPEEVSELTLKISSEWKDSLRVILKEQSTSETAVMRMTTSDPMRLPNWSTDRHVTLLGDALHCMPPTGGQGANSAMGDGMDLAERLSSGERDGEGWTEEVIRAYEQEMKATVGPMVKIGYARAVAWFGMKPMEGFRTE